MGDGWARRVRGSRPGVSGSRPGVSNLRFATRMWLFSAALVAHWSFFKNMKKGKDGVNIIFG